APVPDRRHRQPPRPAAARGGRHALRAPVGGRVRAAPAAHRARTLIAAVASPDRERLAHATALVVVLALAGCASRPPAVPAPDPGHVRAEVARRIPASVDDRQGWATDIQVAFTAQDITANVENICAV